MKASHGFDQCDNGQIAVDETTQLIVATGLTQLGDGQCRTPAADHARREAAGRRAARSPGGQGWTAARWLRCDARAEAITHEDVDRRTAGL